MRRPVAFDAALAAATVILIGLLYGPTLPLPYFWDDFPHFNFAVNKTYGQLWTDVTGLPYYRPVIFTLYKILFEALPFGATALPHGLILALHGFNSLMAGWLAAALRPGEAARPISPQALRLVSTLLFAVYPFGALPLAHFAAAMHPLVTCFTLGGALAVARFLRERRRRWLGLALLCAAGSPFTHEAGIMAGAVMALTWFVLEGRRALRAPLWPAVLLMMGALFVPIWLAVPKSREGTGLTLAAHRPDEFLASATFFSQALTYPAQPLSTFILDEVGGWDLGVILAVGLGAAAPAAIYLWRRGFRSALALAAGWTALTSLPSILALPFDYILISPRLLYLPGIGGVLLWASALGALWSDQSSTLARAWLRLGLAAGLIMGGLVIPVGYVARQTRLHLLALAPLTQLNRLARRAPTERHLVVNTVNWVAHKQKWYPLGTDGVAVLAPYLNVLDLVYINTGVRWPAEVVTFPDLRPDLAQHWLATANEEPSEWWDGAHFSGQAPGFDRVWLTVYTDERAEMQDVGFAVAEPVQSPSVYQASFANVIYLTEAGFTVQDGALSLMLDWVLPRPGDLPADATVFRNVFDCAGNVVGQGSGHPLGAMLFMPALATGARIHDVRHIPLDASAGHNCFQVEVGLFLGDGSRLPVFDPDGAELPNQLFLVRP